VTVFIFIREKGISPGRGATKREEINIEIRDEKSEIDEIPPFGLFERGIEGLCSIPKKGHFRRFALFHTESISLMRIEYPL
jgi:hypothetical protein